MKRTLEKIGWGNIFATVALLVSTASIAPMNACAGGSEEGGAAAAEDRPVTVPGSCTIFTVSFNDRVLFGNNEDYKRMNSHYWVRPSGDGTYGGVLLGFENLSAQGGINGKGLAFDYNALPEAPLTPHPELPRKGRIMRKIHETCTTVEEAIAVIRRHDWGSSLRYQIHLADAKGDAAVISAGPDGEIAVTRKPAGNGFLVSTNFNRANERNTFTGSYPCWRYDTAVEMLEKIESEEDLTIEYVRSILAAAHVEGAIGNTIYSNVFDLKKGIIYLYRWHQFDEVVKLNVAEEIAKAPSPTPLDELFSRKTIDRAADERERYSSSGFILFNSERCGNSEIHIMDTDGGNVRRLTDNSHIDYWPTWAPDGRRIAFSSIPGDNRDIYVTSNTGANVRRLTMHEAIDREPAWSPDGTRIAFESHRDGNPEIYVMDTDGGNKLRLTNNDAADIYAHWSPDGRKIVFSSNRDGNFEIYRMNADGSDLRRLTNNNRNDFVPRWSNDGDKIAYVADLDGDLDLYLIDTFGGGETRLTDSPGGDCELDWSPNDSRFVFASQRDGNWEIYIADLSEDKEILSLTRLTTNDVEDRHPMWLPRRR